MLPAREALERLREGNRRFTANASGADAYLSASRRAELAQSQEPLAIILGCSDSRVPAEIVFDQGLGDLFVIRVAGNIVAPSQVGQRGVRGGALRHAAGRRARPLAVRRDRGDASKSCGARRISQSRNLRSIVDRVRPSVEGLLETDLRHDHDALVRQAVRANIRASANHLRHGSEMLEQLIQDEGLLVVGAEYSLETGVVEFFDGVPKDL